MNQRPNQVRPVQGPGEEEGMENTEHTWQPETLHELARAYFGNEFPPAEQTACPAPDHLRETAQAGRLPDELLRAHLFGCSVCFTEYRTALAARPLPVPAMAGQAAPSYWRTWPAHFRATLSPLPGLVWLTAALVLVTLTWVSWTRLRGASRPATDLSQMQSASRPTPSPFADHTQPATPFQAQQTARPPAPAQASRPGKATVSLDLNEYVALRDTASQNGGRARAIVLPSRRTALQLELPEGSLAGSYTVRLLDEREHPITADTQTSQDGKRLKVTLDLQGLSARTYRLELQHPGAPTALFLVRLATQR